MRGRVFPLPLAIAGGTSPSVARGDRWRMMLPAAGCLDGSDVDLLHRHHGRKGSLCLRATRTSTDTMTTPTRRMLLNAPISRTISLRLLDANDRNTPPKTRTEKARLRASRTSRRSNQRTRFALRLSSRRASRRWGGRLRIHVANPDASTAWTWLLGYGHPWVNLVDSRNHPSTALHCTCRLSS